VHIKAAEYTDVPALTSALTGTHVVISTISFMAIDAQVHIAQAAKAAGASLFVPSEFGGPTDAQQGLFGAKGGLHAKLREVGPPLLLVYTGPFADASWGEYVSSSSYLI
jgi:NmrA-like family